MAASPLTIDVCQSQKQVLKLTPDQLLARLRLKNTGKYSVNFQITRSKKWSDGTSDGREIPSGWYTISPAAGTISPGTTVDVTVVIKAAPSQNVNASFRVETRNCMTELTVCHRSQLADSSQQREARVNIRSAGPSQVNEAAQRAIALGISAEEAWRLASRPSSSRTSSSPQSASASITPVVGMTIAIADQQRAVARRLPQLRAALHSAVTRESRDELRAVIAQESTPTIVGLINSQELADAILSASQAEEQASQMLQACDRGVKALFANKALEARRLFAAANSGMPRTAALLFKMLCELELGSRPSDAEMEAARTLDCDVDEAALCHLVEAMMLTYDASNQTSNTTCSQVILGYTLAFMVHPFAAQFEKGRKMAWPLLSSAAVALKPATASSMGHAQREATAAARMQAKATAEAAKKLLKLTGLAQVKRSFLSIIDKVELSKERGDDMTRENYHTLFLGNPGTGKTTVARYFGELLAELGVLPGSAFEETSGAKLLAGGDAELKGLLGNLDQGGVLFVDEAYQLEPRRNRSGKQVLDLLLTEMEDRRGKLVVIFAGYQKNMEDEILAYNPGLPSRFPSTFTFDDYSDEELCDIMRDVISEHTPTFKLCPRDGAKHLRIVTRRLGRQRDMPGFGNARAVRNLWQNVVRRQTERVVREREERGSPDLYQLTREDVLGPRDVNVASQTALKQLDEMHGLAEVKKSVSTLLQLMQTNAELEENEQPIQQV